MEYTMNNLLNIKSFLKFLSRNKGYTAIDVFGLSVSLMFVILIAVYVERELNIDKQQANYDRIVAIGNEEFLESGVPVSYWLEERYPEIEKVCPVITDQGKSKQIFYGDKKLTADLVYADSTFFGLFSFKILDGDRDRLLEDPYSAVVSESFARKIFGNDDPIGKSLRISDSTSVMVTGVMEDINRSVIPNADLLVRIERVTEFNQSLSKTNPGNAGSCVSFLLLKPGMDLKGRTDEIQSFFKERYWIYRYDFVKEARVVPLSDIYFGNTASHSLNQGDKRFSLVLMSVGILILIFAIINYINLTVAQAGQRAKEMAPEEKLLPMYSNNELNRTLKRIAAICGIERKLVFHVARHTYATEITLSHGVPLETVSKMLGHSRISTTQIYAKVTDDKIDMDTRSLEEKIAGRFSVAI